MPAVGYGDGTITRGTDGRLVVMVSVAGKRRFRTVPARLVRSNPKEAMRRAEVLRRELVELREADLDPSGLTLEAFLRSWIAGLRDAKRSRIRPRTLEHYELVVERHIIPKLGRHRLGRLSERHVQAWLDADAAAPRTIHHHRAVLRRALNVAVRQRVIARNPALAVELPPVPEYRADVLDLEEARALLAATAGDRLGSLWRLALETGLRQGELLGLARDDVDTEARTVTVEAQLQRRRGSWVRVATKAARSLRTIALSETTAAAIEAHKRRMAAERRPDWPYPGLLFVDPDGEPYHQATILRRFWSACDAAGIRRRRFHDLRGSSATLMRELEVPEDVRMARLGHSTTEMARHYGQARPGLDRAAVSAFDEAMRRAK